MMSRPQHTQVARACEPARGADANTFRARRAVAAMNVAAQARTPLVENALTYKQPR